MPWLESHTVLGRHRKLKELAIALRLRPAYVIGHLHLLWHTALEQQEDGDLSAWTEAFIAEAADFPGDAPQFVRLLQETGWLDGRLLHDWLDYSGRYLEAKYRTANPERLKEILRKHPKSALSRSRVGPDDLALHNKPNQPITPGKQVGFSKPTPIEVTNYAKTIGFELDGSRFCAYYDSNGWRVGRNPMRDWRGAVRTWKSKWEEDHGTNGSTSAISYAALARAKRDAEKVRKDAPRESVHAGVRDLPDVQAKADPEP